jgi:glyoxylase-like metal-dependent hydrolase (beta-lactamase superfamily II)
MQHSKFPAEMRAKPITEHLWRMCRWGVANAYLVRETDGSLTLVDTMFRGCGAVIRAASAPLGEVARIVVTHAHWDHAGALDEVADGLPVFAGDALILSGGAQAPGAGYWQVKSPVLAVGTDALIGSLRVIAAPGHTPGQIALLDERDHTLLCGDAFTTVGRVASTGRPAPPFPLPALVSWDRGVAQQTARALTELRPSRLAPGHGRVVLDPIAAMEAASR